MGGREIWYPLQSYFHNDFEFEQSGVLIHILTWLILMVTCCLTDFTTSSACMTGRRFISEEFLPELADNLSWWAVRREVNIRLYKAEGETLGRVGFPGLALGELTVMWKDRLSSLNLYIHFNRMLIVHYISNTNILNGAKKWISQINESTDLAKWKYLLIMQILPSAELYYQCAKYLSIFRNILHKI